MRSLRKREDISWLAADFFRAPASPGFKAHPVARFYGWIILEGTARICKRFFETCSVGKLSLSQSIIPIVILWKNILLGKNHSVGEKKSLFWWKKVVPLLEKNRSLGDHLAGGDQCPSRRVQHEAWPRTAPSCSGEVGQACKWANLFEQGQIGPERSAGWSLIPIHGPRGRGVGLVGPRGSRGVPTGPQGVKGKG